MMRVKLPAHGRALVIGCLWLQVTQIPNSDKEKDNSLAPISSGMAEAWCVNHTVRTRCLSACVHSPFPQLCHALLCGLWASWVSVPGSTMWQRTVHSVSVLPPGRSVAPWLSVLVSWSGRRHHCTRGQVLQFGSST